MLNIKLKFGTNHCTKYLLYLSFLVSIILACSRINIPNNEISDVRVIRVIDGDTIKIDDRKIRLYGMDAPEMKQECRKSRKKWLCGESAKDRLVTIIGNGKNLRCDKKYDDLYKREVAICYVEEKDIGQIMVREGMAVAYRQYSKKYIKDEEYAKYNRLGIWNSKFTEPKIYRLQKNGKNKQRK